MEYRMIEQKGETQMSQTKDGRSLVDFNSPLCQPFFMQGGRHGVLLIHGFTGSVAHMRPMGEDLHALGYTVMGINLPGHATRMEDMKDYKWTDWLSAAKEAYVTLKEKCDLVSVMGVSMGGCLVLMLAQQMRPAACVAMATPMAVQTKLLPLCRIAWPVIRTVPWGVNPARDALLDKEYDLGYSGFPTRSGWQLYLAIKEARRNLHAVCCPLLVVQSDADSLIDHKSADVILSGVSSTVKGRLSLSGVPHLCTISRERPRIVSAADELFRRAEKDAR